jgi:hypothetical protein
MNNDVAVGGSELKRIHVGGGLFRSSLGQHAQPLLFLLFIYDLDRSVGQQRFSSSLLTT